ncbi:MAG: hypothetical protein KA795_15960 [Burkholderiaceae bacterium]|nr:hypothetical protein [Burkholderiaceae bacterium]
MDPTDPPADDPVPSRQHEALQQAQADLADAIARRAQGTGTAGQVLRAGRKLKKVVSVMAAVRRRAPRKSTKR